jgi:hypothetical protein
MPTALDLTYRVGDKVYFDGVPSGIRHSAEIVHLGSPSDSLAAIRWKNGLDREWTQSMVDLRDVRFACHNHGAPFEKTVLDEAHSYRDGYHSGLAIGLAGQFYQAGGPWTPNLSKNSLRPCRHMAQHDEFVQRNADAWHKGWAAGQEQAKMNKKLDFTKPLRTVKDHRPVTYVGPLNALHVVAVDGAPPPILIDERGKVFDKDNPYGVVIENAPQPITYGYVVQTHAGPVSVNVTSLDSEVTGVEWVK